MHEKLKTINTLYINSLRILMTFSELLHILSAEMRLDLDDAIKSGGCTLCFDGNINLTFEHHDNQGLEKQKTKIGKTSIALHEKLTFLPTNVAILKSEVTPNQLPPSDTLAVGTKNNKRLLLSGVSEISSAC